MIVADFFEALAAVGDQNARWDELVAGLAVLRVVEATLSNDGSAHVLFDRASAVIASLANTPLRGLLNGILTSTEADGRLPIRLMAYGIWLHAQGLFAPAANVFMAAESAAADDDDIRLQAIQKRAYMLRLLQRFDEAQAAYAELKERAERNQANLMKLEAELGAAKLIVERGNTPQGELAVREVLEHAKREGQSTIAGKALIDLAAIAGIRRQPWRLLEYADAALDVIDDPGRRERLMINMAHAFRELGHGETAASTARYVSETSKQAEHRTRGHLILYHLAIDAGQWRDADAYRTALADVRLSPAVEAEYYEAVARHHATIGAVGPAVVMLQRMLAVAEEHRLAELTIRAEEAIAEVRRGIVPALYDFRPLKRIPKRESAVVARVERSITALLATG